MRRVYDHQVAHKYTKRAYDEEAQNDEAPDDVPRALNFVDGMAQDGNLGRNDIHQVPPPMDAQRVHNEEAQSEEYPDDISPYVSRLTLVFLFEKFFAPLVTVVYIFNITAALGYVTTMNEPAPPKSSYIVGYVTERPFHFLKANILQGT